MLCLFSSSFSFNCLLTTTVVMYCGSDCLIHFSARETWKRNEDQADEGRTTGWSKGKRFCVIVLFHCPFFRHLYFGLWFLKLCMRCDVSDMMGCLLLTATNKLEQDFWGLLLVALLSRIHINMLCARNVKKCFEETYPVPWFSDLLL